MIKYILKMFDEQSKKMDELTNRLLDKKDTETNIQK